MAEHLTWNSRDGGLRARFSGTVDLEGYDTQLPAPGVLQTDESNLGNARVTTFLDAQLGPRIYAFAQARADGGFDPGAADFRLRFDEYAIRFTPGNESGPTFQIGKFPVMVGNWIPRHLSWANPFVTAPLPYEHLTGIWDIAAARSSGVLLSWSHVRSGFPLSGTAEEKSLRVPILWGPAYASGVAVAGAHGRLRYALELKHASLSSRPDAWSHPRGAWAHPTVNGRLGWRPNPTWDFGLSASVGSYLRPFAGPTVAPGQGLGDYRQIVVGHDASFAWHHLQIWAEIYAARFEVPPSGTPTPSPGMRR